MHSFYFSLSSGTEKKKNLSLHRFMWPPLVNKVENDGVKQTYPPSKCFF